MRQLLQAEVERIRIGDTVCVIVQDLGMDDLITLKKLDNKVTIDDIDYVAGNPMGFYCKEIPGLLITFRNAFTSI